MMELKTYPKLKKYENWIGPVPDNWKTEKARYLFEKINKRSITGSETLLSVSEYYGVKPKKETIGEGEYLTHASSLIDYKKCKKNNLVMNIMLAWKRGLGVTKYDGIVSPAYEVFKINKKLNPDYVHYLLRTQLYSSEMKRNSYGIIDSRLRLYPENFYDIQIIEPPLDEQKQIAKYLDNKTSQIEENIAKNKKLIELLKEKRTALINQTVTKGLNPDTPMKESGLKWIEKIPEHWEINKIKNLFEFTKGLNITKKDLTVNGIPVISYGQIHAKFNDGVHIKNELIRYTDKSNAKTNSKVSKGDFIFADTSEDIEGCGNSIYINKDMLLYGGYHDVILKSRNKRDNTYLAYLFQSETWRKQLRSKVNGVKVYSINQSILKECYVLIPPNEEQKILVEYLDKTSKNIDKTVEKIERNIELLEEYKESLIHHVVTGKVDVRGVEI